MPREMGSARYLRTQQTPVTVKMHDEIKAAAAESEQHATEWARDAFAEKLKRQARVASRA